MKPGFVDHLLGRLSGVAEPRALPAASAPVPGLPAWSGEFDRPLVMLTPNDPWTIRDSFEGTQIFGEPGSGKTSGSGAALARAMLRAGNGGLVLTAKPDERALWERYARESGRSGSLLIVSPHQPWRFNFLDYELSRPGEGAGFAENVVELFMNVIGAMESDGRQAGEKFWDNNARRLLRHTLELIVAAGDTPTMTRIMDVIDGAPSENPETQEMKHRPDSYCDACLARARERGAAQLPGLERFWMQWARQPHKTRAGIEATLTGMADPFLSGMAAGLFATETNFTPEWSLLGAVIVIDLSEAKWFQAGRRAQLLFKYIWQRAVMRRTGLPRGHRPVFLFVDEAQTFTTPLDAQFQAVARSSCAATVYLTQNISNYLAILEPQRGQAQADSLLANLGTKIFHRNTDHRTNQWAAETIGKGTLIRRSGGSSRSFGRSRQRSQSDGRSYGPPTNDMLLWGATTVSTQDGFSSGLNSSEGENTGWREEVDFLIQPQVFTALSGGGPQNGWTVQAIVMKGGKRFAYTGLPVTGAAFVQERA